MQDFNSHPSSVSRRTFLRTSGSIAFYIGSAGILPQLVGCTDQQTIAEELEKHPVTAWVRLSADGRITIYNPAAEMGQGSMTALPVIFAEEMDADWEMVSVEFSPQESAVYGSGGWGSQRKIMLSAGSRVTKGYYPTLRKAGAEARYVLLHSVAQSWEVPIEELSTEPNVVIHEKTGRRMSYGEVLSILDVPDPMPAITEDQLKSPDEFRLIGKDLPRTDIPSKVDGSAQFAIDVRLPDMLYGVLERGNRHGATPELKNEEAIRAASGIIEVVKLEHAIGIIADNLTTALAAKKDLQIEWTNAPTKGFNSQEAYAQYEKIAGEKGQEANVVTDDGNMQQALRKAAKVYRADYRNDYVYHAQMEPLNAVVQVGADGNSAEAWVGSQQGFDAKLGIPNLLGIPPENVKINLQYLGGGLGRRSMTDFITECALLAKEVAPRPVKLIWTREDDLQYGAYRPMSLQRLTAALDPQGRITGLSHVIIGDGDRLLASGIKNRFYDIPNQYAELRIIPHHVRLKHWRAVGHGPNKFAIECFIDEIAAGQGIDPVAFRRQLMAKAPRALATLEKAAAMSGWDTAPEEGRAKGVAFLERSGTLSTGVCEISLDRTTGKIKVHRFWSANDAGIVIQPHNVKAQIEGGIIMGLSSVLKEQLTIVDGAVQQSNFHDYQLLRVQDIPESIETAIMPSSAPPEGVGESGTPLVACAVANAFFKLTGKKLRHLPFTPERVLEALNS